MSMASAEDFLRTYGQNGDEQSLFEVALTLAGLDQPERTLEPYLDFMRRLEEDLKPLAAVHITASARAGYLAEYLGNRHGFSGDRKTYDALENANLMSVIDRRQGLPISLGILYIHLARSLGWPAYGLNFPAHFLVRIDGLADRVVMDPFNDGAILTTAGMRHLLKTMTGEQSELRPEHYAAMTDRDLLLRLQSNIKVRRLNAGDFVGAIAVLERMLLIAPMNADLWYDLGILEVHRGHREAGRDALGKCLATLEATLDKSGSQSAESRILRDRARQSLRELQQMME